MDAFQTLGLEPVLVISDEQVRDAYRETGRRLHPDAGGGEGEFAGIREALAVVSSPSRRLRLWLELRGIPAEMRGTVGASLMDLFSEVGGATQQAEELIRKRDDAKSALARAMLEGEALRCREAIERAVARVEERIGLECGRLPGFQDAPSLDPAEASECVRNLAFLEKWRSGLRACYSRLV